MSNLKNEEKTSKREGRRKEGKIGSFAPFLSI
jgi:hypothetical protein